MNTSVIVCDIVEVWSSCQKTTKKVPKNKPCIAQDLHFDQLRRPLSKMKPVLVTGGNTGIGLALCELLVQDHGCFVYLGSRNLERGTQAVNSVKEKVSRLRLSSSILYISTFFIH